MQKVRLKITSNERPVVGYFGLFLAEDDNRILSTTCAFGKESDVIDDARRLATKFEYEIVKIIRYGQNDPLSRSAKFVPQTKTKPFRDVLSLHLDQALSMGLAQAQKKTKLHKQNLVRQMIRHCLRDMGIIVPEVPGDLEVDDGQ